MKNLNKKVITILLSITVFSFVTFFVFMYIMEKIINMNFILYFLSYIVLFASFSFLNTKFPNVKIISFVFTIISIPIGILYFIMRISFPIIAILGYLLCFCLFICIIPAFLLWLNDLFSIIIISRDTYLFIFFTLSTIIATSFFKPFIRITDKCSFLRLGTSQKMEKAKIKELIHYIFTLKNIRFCIYIIYFVFMIIYSIKTLENKTSLELTIEDNAIMQSFLVYLAFDNIINNIKKISFSSLEFLKRILHSIFIKDDNEIENDNLTK